MPTFLCQVYSMYPSTCPHFTCKTIPQKDTMISYLTQSCSPLNSQVLAKFFPFETRSAMPHYQVFTDRYSPQYGMHFMTNILFDSPPLFPSLLHFHLVSQSCSWSSPVHTTIPDPSDNILVIPLPSSLSLHLI